MVLLRRRAAALLLPVLLTAACGSSGAEDAPAAQTEPLRIVSTVAPITSIVSNVVGDRAEVVGIVPEGTNSHTFEPPPQAAASRPTVAAAITAVAHRRVTWARRTAPSEVVGWCSNVTAPP